MAVEMYHEMKNNVSSLLTLAKNWARLDMKTMSSEPVGVLEDTLRAMIGSTSSLERLTRKKLIGIHCLCIVSGSDNGLPTSTENTAASWLTSSSPNSIRTALGIVTGSSMEYLKKQFPEMKTATAHCTITIGDLVSVPSIA